MQNTNKEIFLLAIQDQHGHFTPLASETTPLGSSIHRSSRLAQHERDSSEITRVAIKAIEFTDDISMNRIPQVIMGPNGGGKNVAHVSYFRNIDLVGGIKNYEDSNMILVKTVEWRELPSNFFQANSSLVANNENDNIWLSLTNI